MSRLRAIWIVAALTLREALRRRLLWVLVGLTVLIVAVTAWAFARVAEASPVTGPLEQLAVSQLLVFMAFMFSFVLAMTAVFGGSPAIGPDIESGLLLAVLARPVRRSDVLLGRWLGLAAVLGGYALIAGYLELGVVGLVTGYFPSDPLVAPPYLAGEALVLLTLAIVFSTRITSVAGGAIAVVAFGLGWMGGIMGGVGEFLNNDVLRTAGTLTHVLLPSDVLWRGAVFALAPPPDVLDAAGPAARAFTVSPFAASAGPAPVWLGWSCAWIAGALVLGALLLRRREL